MTIFPKPLNFHSYSLFIVFFIFSLFLDTAAFSSPKTERIPSRSLENFRDLTAAMQPGEWLELPGTINQVFVDKEKTQGEGEIIGPVAVIIAWNGAAWDNDCGYFLGGGHQDYGGNEVYSYCWEGKRPFHWEVLMPPSKSDPNDHSPCPHPKEGPRAYHTYDGIIYVPDTKSIFIWGSVGYCRGGFVPTDEVPELILEPNPKWNLHPKGQGPFQQFAHTAYNDRNGQVYLWEGKRQVYIFDPKSLKYEGSGEGTADYGSTANLIYDNPRNVLWAIVNQGLFQFVLGPKGEVLAFKKIIDADQFPAGLSGTDGMELRKGKLYFWSGNTTVHTFDPESGKWSSYSANKGPGNATRNGIFSKWHYIEKYDVFVGVSHHLQGMWVWKPSEGESPQDTRQISLCKADGESCVNHKLLSSALYEIKPGSTLKFSSAHYIDSAVIIGNDLKFIGETGASIQGIVAEKATFVAAGNDLVFDNLNVTLPDGAETANEACFRGEGKNLTLLNINCHDMQMGVIGGKGTLTIEHSKFENSGLNGNADLGHMVYACSNGECPDGSLVIRDSKFVRMGVNRPGHGIKSRAPKNLIENVVIAGIDSHSGRAIDISQGGDTIIRNVVMQLGPNSDNEDFIGLAMETKNFPIHTNNKTLIENVIAICDQPKPCDFIRYNGAAPKLNNIVLIGNFKFYDDQYPISKEGIKIYRNRAEAGLKDYPYIPEKWMQINTAN